METSNIHFFVPVKSQMDFYLKQCLRLLREVQLIFHDGTHACTWHKAAIKSYSFVHGYERKPSTIIHPPCVKPGCVSQIVMSSMS